MVSLEYLQKKAVKQRKKIKYYVVTTNGEILVMTMSRRGIPRNKYGYNMIFGTKAKNTERFDNYWEAWAASRKILSHRALFDAISKS